METPNVTESGSTRDSVTAPHRILVVGAPRSGTSWLGYAMARARGARFYYEPDDINATRTVSRPAGRLGFGPYPVIDPGEDDNPFTPVWDMAFSGRLPRVESKPMLLAARVALRVPRSVRDPMVHRAAAVAARIPSRRRWAIVKTIYATFSLDWLLDRYRPQVVAIQRNPLNVVSSWRQLRIPYFDLATRPAIRKRYLDPLGIGAPRADEFEVSRIAWHVGLLTHALSESVERHPETLVVTHEDLCREPVHRIRGVFDRLGLDWTDDVERFLDNNNRPGEGLRPVRVTKDQPDRWRERLSDKEVDEIHNVLEAFPRRGWIRMPDSASA